MTQAEISNRRPHLERDEARPVVFHFSTFHRAHRI